MMKQSIIFSPAVELVQKIKGKKLSVVEVVKAFLEQIEHHNPTINAIYELRDKEDILKEAAQKDAAIANGEKLGALHGLPMTIKDSFAVKGMISSNGDPFLKKNRATEDAALVKRLKDAGAIILGKTIIPLFCIDWQSTNSWNGQTNNPYDLSRVAGGSSGGAAAAVVAGFSALELGSDAGGSIRVPAHFCGLCGLRPTEKALPINGHLKYPNKPDGNKHIVVAGPLAKNMADLQLMLQVLWNNKDYPLQDNHPIDLEQSTWDNTPLKIAVAKTINDTIVDQEYAAIFQGFINKIQAKNHAIYYDHPVYDEAKAYQTCGKILGFENCMNAPQLPLTAWGMYAFIRFKYRDHAWAKSMFSGINLSPTNYAKAIDFKRSFSAIYQRFFDQYDVWITPVCAIEAFKHQRAGIPFMINNQKTPYTKAIGSFTFTTALSGHPILVIPIGRKKNGMPVGVQIHAPKWSDNRLVEIGKAFEQLVEGFRIPKLG